MSNRLKSFIVAVVAIGSSFVAGQANAQYGIGSCSSGYGASFGRQSYAVPLGYGYNAPIGYSSYYAGYPGYSSYRVPQVYSGTSLYMSPGLYSVARVAVPAYPVYRPMVVPAPIAPGFVPGRVGLRIGF